LRPRFRFPPRFRSRLPLPLAWRLDADSSAEALSESPAVYYLVRRPVSERSRSWVDGVLRIEGILLHPGSGPFVCVFTHVSVIGGRWMRTGCQTRLAAVQPPGVAHSIKLPRNDPASTGW